MDTTDTAAGTLPATWINGVRQAVSGAHVPASDRGLLLADGAFETMVARGGQVLRLDAHLTRLRQALETLAIPVPDNLRGWAMLAAGAAGDADVAMRVTVTRGSGPPGLAPPDHASPLTLLTIDRRPAFPRELYDRGVRAHVSSGRRNQHAITANLKTLAYTETIAAWIEARRAGADDVLWLDTDGHCSEASSSNLFICDGGAIVTPPVSCGVLPGITRAIVLEVAAARGIRAVEEPFDLEALLDADEAFLTSTLRGVVGLTRVGDRSVGSGMPGAMTRIFADAYAELLARECL